MISKATRVHEGAEDDQYRCERGHRFGMDWSKGPAEEPQWPPPLELEGVTMDIISGGRQVDFLWGFLAVIFALVLFRSVTGDTTGTAGVLSSAFSTVLLVASIAAWISSRRHPARLEITSKTIELRHGDKPDAVTLRRTDGDLYVRRVFSGWKYPQSYLKATHSDAAISLLPFDSRKVEEACREAGWRFVGNEHAQ